MTIERPRPWLRRGLWVVQAAREALWFCLQPATRGVDAIALTAAGKVVLVRLTYAEGWRLPGGGQKRRESELQAVRRELAEEIGMTGHGTIVPLGSFFHRKYRKRETITVYLVRDVVYRARPTWEIAAVAEFSPGDVPIDAAYARRWIGEAIAAGHLESTRFTHRTAGQD